MQSDGADRTLSPAYLEQLDAYWRAANYLAVGQIYLLDNPLLREPLTLEHVKPRLLGHWGTTPGLNFIYAHLNRVITKLDLDMIYVAGPGHVEASSSRAAPIASIAGGLCRGASALSASSSASAASSSNVGCVKRSPP